MTTPDDSEMAPIDLAREEDFAMGRLEVSPSTRQVRMDDAGKSETLEPRVMQVLVALARRRGEVTSRDSLFRQCWEGRIVGDDAMNRCISRLRRLSENTGQFAIEAIPKVGYRLMVIAPAEKMQTPPPQKERLRRDTIKRRGVWGWALLAALIGAAILGGWILHTARFVAKDTPNRVAVLPFEGLSSDKNVHFFGEAVADQIVAVLNENQVLAITRNDLAPQSGQDGATAAERLGADYLLSGTVQKSAQGLHVIVHLDRISTHATIWTATFDQFGSDPVTLQSQIAAKAVDQVKAALRATSSADIDDEALTAYLKAEEFGRLGGHLATAFRRDQMRKVVARAPHFSRGYSGLAVATAQLIHFSDETESLRAEAKRAAERALDLAPNNGEAYLAMAIMAPGNDVAAQEALYRRGLAIDPNEPTLNSNLAYLLSDLGRNAEALSYHRRSVILDPLSPRKNAGLADSLATNNLPNEARSVMENSEKLWPDNGSVWGRHFYIAYVFGHYDEALVILNHPPTGRREPDFIAALRMLVMARKAPTPQNRAKAIALLTDPQASHNFGWSARIEMLAQLGDIDKAYSLIGQYYFGAGRTAGTPEHTRMETSVLFLPTTAKLRSDPRFGPLLRRTGLFAYWAHRVDLPDFCASETAPVCTDIRNAQAARRHNG